MNQRRYVKHRMRKHTRNKRQRTHTQQRNDKQSETLERQWTKSGSLKEQIRT